MIKISAEGQAMVDSGEIRTYMKFYINGVDRTSDLLPNYTYSFNRAFGSASFQGELANQSGKYSEYGDNAIKIDHKIILYEGFVLPTGVERWKKITALVRQINPKLPGGRNTIAITAFDVIIKLRDFDINKSYEADKFYVENEVLKPNYLPAPLENLAQVYDFKNKNIAHRPPVSIVIRDKTGYRADEPQPSGWEVNYIGGQIKLGTILNVRDNYDILATYSYYVEGNFAEDIIEDAILQPDGYGNNYFTTATNLRSTFQEEDGEVYDYLRPNYFREDIEIRTRLTQAVAEGDTSILITNTDGFLSSGTANINGWAFTYTSKDTTHFYGIPASGDGSLRDHVINSMVHQMNTYEPGLVWYMKYNNIVTQLVKENFTVPSDVTIEYVDLRNGRIILDQPADPYTDYGSVYVGDYAQAGDYEFCTIQATGIEIPYIKFSWQKTKTRFDAITTIKELLAPNYVMRTKGDEKIWGEYLTQRYTHDYVLPMSQAKSISYAEDQDIYTRVRFFGKNNNPHNYMFDPEISFVDVGETYTGIVYNHELAYNRTEGPWHVYKTGLSQSGFIRVDTFEPVVYINNVAVDNDKHLIVSTQVQVREHFYHETRVYHQGDKKNERTEVYNEWTYTVLFSHSGIDPSEIIYIYDSVGVVLYELGPNENSVDYTHGIWNVPGIQQNEKVLTCSTATYTIMYSSDKVSINYDDNEFLIHRDLLSLEFREDDVRADFEYQEMTSALDSPGALIDGRPTTQVQAVFYGKPVAGYVIATLDLGDTRIIDAIDLTAGFFRPDEIRRVNFTNFYSIEWSLNGTTFFPLCRESVNFSLGAGESKSWEREELGDDFEARYLRLILEDAQKVEYKEGVWCIALAEFAVYRDVVLIGEAKLIPTTLLAQATADGDAMVYVDDKVSAFNVPGVGSTEIAYIGESVFSYSGVDATNNILTGCLGTPAAIIGTRVSQQLVDDTHIYDDDGLLPRIGDKLYKDEAVKKGLTDQDKVNKRAKDWIEEFYKNHSRASSNHVYCPHFDMGQTLLVQDEENSINRRYFIENITGSGGGRQVTLAMYP